jgi:TIGR03009 family protein
MSRKLAVGRFIGLMLLGALGAPDIALNAQEGANVDPAIAPSAEPVDQNQRIGRSGLTRPDLRAGAVDPNAGTPVDPRIDSLLEEWSHHTKEIKRLQGSHLRATRNFTFGTESWAEGRFYVETPDKGRFDLQPYSKKLPYKSVSRPGPKGAEFTLSLQCDSKHDRWICDGKEIKAISDDDKTVEVVKIPPSQRGENIMDGPLPFLFGMPPEKAKARYRFKLLGQNNRGYAIQVRPNWKQDAVDWAQAELLLDRKTFLPQEVHLHDAPGTTETVYIFRELDVNRIRIFFWQNPFDPPLFTYKRSVHNTPPTGEGRAPSIDPLSENRMPSLIGMTYDALKPVKKRFESLGYSVKLQRGNPAAVAQLVYVVEQQEPPKGAPLDPKSPIVLTLYDKLTANPDPRVNRTETPGDGTRTVAKPTDP